MSNDHKKYPRYLITALLLALGGFTLLAIGFLGVMRFVVSGASQSYDERVLLAINAWSTPLLDTTMRTITDFGSVGVAAVVVIAALLYVRNHHTYRALFIVSAVGGAAILSVVLKLLFSRPRPDLWQHLVVEETFSFPSGHAIASSALAFSVMILLWRTRYRWLGVITGVVYMLTIGFSRMYLGVHYPTDIIAGWLVSAAWVLLVATMLWHRRQVRHAMKALDDTTK